MKVTIIDSAILGGQGSIGSRPLTVANPAPLTGTGPAGSGADGNLDCAVTVGTAPTNSGNLAPKSGEQVHPEAVSVQGAPSTTLGDAVLGAPVKGVSGYNKQGLVD